MVLYNAVFICVYSAAPSGHNSPRAGFGSGNLGPSLISRSNTPLLENAMQAGGIFVNHYVVLDAYVMFLYCTAAVGQSKSKDRNDGNMSFGLLDTSHVPADSLFQNTTVGDSASGSVPGSAAAVTGQPGNRPHAPGLLFHSPHLRAKEEST